MVNELRRDDYESALRIGATVKQVADHFGVSRQAVHIALGTELIARIQRERAESIRAQLQDAFPDPSHRCSRCGIELRQRGNSRYCADCRLTDHGTTTNYDRGCRCTACRRAASERNRKQRADRMANRDRMPASAHGSSGYSNWGCRCEVCTSGERARRERDRNRPDPA